MDLLYGTRILAVDYFVLSQSTRLIDGLTDRQKGDSKTVRMHSQLHGKIYFPSNPGWWKAPKMKMFKSQ